MNKNKIFIGICLLIIFGIFIYEAYDTNRIIQKNKELTVINNKLDNNLKIYKDENNFYRAKAETAESDIRNVRRVYEEELKTLKNDFNNINKNYKNLLNVYNISLETNNKLNLIIESYDKFVDTVFNENNNITNIRYTRKFTYNDDWSKFYGFYTLNTNDKFDDKIEINYTTTDSITLVSYFKRKNIFSSRQLYVEGKSYNPNTQISNLKEIRIDNYKEPKWSIGTQVGYGITQHGMGWYAGVGINRKLLQW
jgi:hypothetical protein